MTPALTGLLLAVFASPAVGVVALPRGPVTQLPAGAAQHAASVGDVLRAGDVIETGSDGWLEVRLLHDVRLRLSAESRVQLDAHRVGVLDGRVWVERGARPSPLLVIVGGLSVRSDDASSFLAERGVGGPSVSVGSGVVDVRLGDRVNRVRAGLIATVFDEAVLIRAGGSAVLDLLAAEARGRRRDVVGLQAFLLARVAATSAQPLPTRGIADIMRLDAEVMGADDGHVGLSVEAAIRPPAFFEEEVPPKGPNVRVEVQFGGE